MIGVTHANQAKILNELSTPLDQEIPQELHTDAIEQMIMICRVHAVSDASLKDGKMAAYWKMVTRDNNLVHDKKLCHKRWGNNIPKAAEAIACLDMLETIQDSVPEETNGELVVIIDNQQMHNMIVNQWKKSGTFTLDSLPTIHRIKNIIEHSSFEIIFQLATKYKKKEYDFKRDPERYLMKQCDREAKKAWNDIENQEGLTNMMHYGVKALSINNMIAERPLREAIRLCDVQKEELEYLKTKFPNQIQFIDREARHVFHKGSSSSLLKCVYGINHHATRDTIINQDVCNYYCPRCSQIKTWEHVIKCTTATELKNQCMKQLHKKLKSQDKIDAELEKRNSIITDTCNYMCNRQAQPQTNQRRIGMRYIFRGIVTKDWTSLNPIDNKDFKCNRIIVKISVEFYHKCWKHRCDQAHDETIQRTRLKEWYRNLFARINTGDLYHLKRCVNMRALNLDQTHPTIIE